MDGAESRRFCASMSFTFLKGESHSGLKIIKDHRQVWALTFRLPASTHTRLLGPPDRMWKAGDLFSEYGHSSKNGSFCEVLTLYQRFLLALEI